MNPASTRITFGMIVLNGEPFLRYNLRALYPFAHQVIVVEGASPSAAAIATLNGHSTDGTLETLRAFKHNEDPEDKVVIVTAQDEGHEDGFWRDKNEMSRAYAKRATGNYLWQVDSDEFYHEEQIRRLMELLATERPDAVSFPMLTFWGSTRYITNSFYLVRDNAREYHRLFAWDPGYSYATHFPPTVLDDRGINLRRKLWFQARQLEKRGIFLYHYSLLFPQQVYNKVSYYKARERNAIDTWEDVVYRRLEKPFRAHNVYRHIGWLERFDGVHPASVIAMMSDIEVGNIDIQTRDCADVERLLSDSRYIVACRILSVCARVMSYKPIYFIYRIYAGLLNRTRKLVSARSRKGTA